MSDKEHELQARRLANAIAYGGGDQPVGYVDAAKKLAFSEVIAENKRAEALRLLRHYPYVWSDEKRGISDTDGADS